MEFAAPENAKVLSGRKSLKSAAKSVTRQTLKRQLSSGGRQRRVILTNTSKQTSPSSRDNFIKNFRYSCQKISGNSLMWQFLETLEVKS